MSLARSVLHPQKPDRNGGCSGGERALYRQQRRGRGLTNGSGTDTWAWEEITSGMEAVIYGRGDGGGLTRLPLSPQNGLFLPFVYIYSHFLFSRVLCCDAHLPHLDFTLSFVFGCLRTCGGVVVCIFATFHFTGRSTVQRVSVVAPEPK